MISLKLMEENLGNNKMRIERGADFSSKNLIGKTGEFGDIIPQVK